MPDRVRRSEPPESSSQHADKTCATCGRAISWRKRWERSWDEVRFCSDACRAHKPSAKDHALELMIVALLRARGRDKTICPSEAARAVAASDERTAWEPLMEPARQAARRLVAAGVLDITQGGRVVDASTAKGAIRLRLR